jgi:hypothetical protein
MKNDIDKDNSLLPLCSQDTKKGKELRSKEATPLLVVLHLLVAVGLVIIIIIAVVNTSKTNTKGSQLSGSQRVIRGLGWVGRQGHRRTQRVAHAADCGRKSRSKKQASKSSFIQHQNDDYLNDLRKFEKGKWKVVSPFSFLESILFIFEFFFDFIKCKGEQKQICSEKGEKKMVDLGVR